MTTHKLKSWPAFFKQIATGKRTHELRRNDRNFQVGDILELREWNPVGGQHPDRGTFTGAWCLALITSITSESSPCAVSEVALHADFCILSILPFRTGDH